MLRTLLMTAGFAMIASGAMAQNGGLYVRGGAGISLVDDLDQDITANLDTGAPCVGPGCDIDRSLSEFATGYAFALAAGYDFGRFRTELEFRNSAADIDQLTIFDGPNDFITTNPDGDFSNNFLFGNLYYDFENPTNITPFVGGGLGLAFSEDDFDESDTVLAYQARVGVSFAVTGNLSVDGEYIYQQTSDLVFEGRNIGPVDSLRVDGDGIGASLVMVSLRAGF